MIKLYYSPGACSLSPHIALCESGLQFEIEKVDTKAKKTASGGDYLAINPNGYVPALQIADGKVITEGPAIVQWIADQAPQTHLAPPNGTWERTQLQQWLNFISTEIHKSYSPLFSADVPDAYKAMTKDKLFKRYAYVNDQLKGREFLVGNNFTVADGYLFTVTNWANFLKLDLSEYREVRAFSDRVNSRPKVLQALKAEGLVK
ncbi:MAG: glutathione transferase GstA [Alphaproteobacteria bacterium]|nr:glutathione transferase GstA [Alphaproteobacteria bacterium]